MLHSQQVTDDERGSKAESGSWNQLPTEWGGYPGEGAGRAGTKALSWE